MPVIPVSDGVHQKRIYNLTKLEEERQKKLIGLVHGFVWADYKWSAQGVVNGD
jgi:hypothetical protein